MIRSEREVTDPKLICEMLKLFDTLHLGLHDTDGYPYVVPLSFGFEMTEDELLIYTHFSKKGHKLDLMRLDPHVCAEFSEFYDFPDHKYKGHYHDYRSVIAKGLIHIVDANENYELYNKAYESMYTCNGREVKPLKERPSIPPVYMAVIECEMKNVTAKSEFPIRTVEDVPFIDVYSVPNDNTPFDISDIIASKKTGKAKD